MSTSLRFQTGAALATMVILASACGTSTTSSPEGGAVPPVGGFESAASVDGSAAPAVPDLELTTAPVPPPAAQSDPSPIDPPSQTTQPSDPEIAPPAPEAAPDAPLPHPDPDPAETDPDPDPADPDPADPAPTEDPDPAGPDPLPDMGDVLVAVEVGDPGLEVVEFGAVELGAGVALPECGLVSTAPAHSGTSSAWPIDAASDGTADDVVTVFYNGAWRLRLYPSTGGTSEVTLSDPGDADPTVLGAVRLEGGDAVEVIVKLHTDGDHSTLGLFGMDDRGCAFQYTYASGYGVVLSVRETPDLHEGVWCAGSVGQYRAERLDDGTWDWFMTSLALTGATTLDWIPGWGDNASGSELNPVGFDCLGYQL